MESFVSFFTTYVRPFLDVVVLAFLIYQVYRILLQNNALPAIKGVVAAAALYAIAFILKLDTILWILNRLAGALIIIVVIIFQSEIRNFFTKVGQSRFLQRRHRTIGTEIESVVSAAEILSSMKRGALIVTPHVATSSVAVALSKPTSRVSRLFPQVPSMPSIPTLRAVAATTALSSPPHNPIAPPQTPRIPTPHSA